MSLFYNALFLGLFVILTLSVGVYCRRHSTDVNGFVLGGRSVGPWLTAFAYGTSYFSAVVFVGYAGQFGWLYGISATWAGIGNALVGSLMAWSILGRRTRVMTQHLDSATMPQFFGERFKDDRLKVGASLIIFVFLIPYTASLYNGLSRLFAMGFDLDYSICIILMAALTAIYVVMGGYMAAAINDFIQGIIMLTGISILVWAVLASQGGFTAALSKLAAASDPHAIPVPGVLNGATPGVFASFLGPDPVNLFFVVILTSLGTWGLPQMVQKFYAITNEGAIHKGTIISTLFALVVAGGCYFMGGFGRIYADRVNIAANGYDSIIPTMLESLHPALIALTVILVLAASMSTLSSLVIASSSTLAIDFLHGCLLKNRMSIKAQLLTIRALIVVFIAISAAIALLQYSSRVTFIAQLMGISWGALAGSFLAPFLYALYWKRTTKAACWTCFVFSCVLMIADMIPAVKEIMPEIMRSPINCGGIAMLAGLVIVPVVSLFTKPPEKTLVDHIFSCYDKKVTVSVKTAVEEQA